MDVPKIEFWTKTPGLTQIHRATPKPAREFFPEWFKKMPLMFETSNDIDTRSRDFQTVKRCPGIVDYMTQGYVVPMWCDIKIKFEIDENGDETYHWTTYGDFTINHHRHEQFKSWGPTWIKDEFRVVMKFNNPWNIKTPKGYSVYQMPMWYHFNRSWTVFPGTIESDWYHETNLQLIFHDKQQEVIIKQGDPLCVFIPYKREQYDLEVRESTEEDKLATDSTALRVHTKMTGAYREEQRRRKQGEQIELELE